jgi:hypothetical protein
MSARSIVLDSMSSDWNPERSSCSEELRNERIRRAVEPGLLSGLLSEIYVKLRPERH